MQQLFSKMNLAIIFAAIGSVYIFGMFIDVMDIDAAQYASLSREMLDSKSFLQIKLRFQDYLDKPPLAFWLASFSFWLFGFSNWAYKLPSVLFSILAIYSTYRFAKIYYSRDISILSSLILATCQAYFLINNDVRTDTILIGCIAFASWHLAAFLKEKNSANFLFAFLGIGLAMLSKGPLGLMVPVLGFGTDLLLKREFKKIFQWQWILGFVIIAIVLFPMCYGLYLQYGNKGLIFYFWEQSFGRITGSNATWQNNPDPFFLVHSFLWSFLPWPLLFLVAFYFKAKTLWNQKFKLFSTQEFVTVGAIVFSFIILSRSQYQLPHYIYGILPYASVVTASFVLDFLVQSQKWAKGFNIIQIIVCLGLWIICGLLTIICFEPSAFHLFLFGLGGGIFLSLIFKKGYNTVEKIILISCVTSISVNFLMNSHIYPSILKYQPSHEIANYLKSNHIDKGSFFIYNDSYSHSLDFYTESITSEIRDVDKIDSLKKTKDFYVNTNEEGMHKLEQAGIEFSLVKSFEEYRVTKLSLPFLNPKTRDNTLTHKYLIRLAK